MQNNTAYFLHNPRCSKSRQALKLVQNSSLEFSVIEYLKEPLSYEQLLQLSQSLNVATSALIRHKDAEFKALNLKLEELSDEQIVTLIHQQPKLLERPILVVGEQARIGRPPENVMELIS